MAHDPVDEGWSSPAARWLPAAVACLLGVAVGLLGSFLLIVVVVAIGMLVAGALRIVGETRSLPRWGRPSLVVLGSIVAVGVGLMRVFGVLGGLLALAALAAAFLLLGGDLG